MNAEILRLLQNIAILGTVTHIKPENQTMRLQVGDNQTDWVSIPTLSAGKVSVWRCPSVGEQFLLLCPSGSLENAVPVISLYSNNNPTPSTDENEVRVQFNDTDFMSVIVDDSSAELTISSITLNAQSQVTINTPTTTLTGDLQVDGNIHADGDIVADTVSLKNHTHTGVLPGDANTGTPNS